MVGPEIAEAPPPDVGGDVEGAPERAPAAPAAERAGTGSRRLYVGNLPYDIDSDALRAMFADTLIGFQPGTADSAGLSSSRSRTATVPRMNGWIVQ